MKKLIISIMSIIVLSNFLHANELKYMRSYNAALAKAKETNKSIMVMMSIDGCITCDYMKDIVFEREKVLSYLNKHYITVIKELNKETYPDRFAAIDAPTFFFVDPITKKNIIDRTVGGLNPKNFLALLHAVTPESNETKATMEQNLTKIGIK
jgi:thioredoxin-related protein